VILFEAPDYNPSIRAIGSGILWLDDRRFLCHGRTAAAQLGILQDSLRRNLKNNRFTTESSVPLSRTLEDPRGWKIHSHPDVRRERDASAQQPFAGPMLSQGQPLADAEKQASPGQPSVESGREPYDEDLLWAFDPDFDF
jgi:hypothetical protein